MNGSGEAITAGEVLPILPIKFKQASVGRHINNSVWGGVDIPHFSLIVILKGSVIF